MVTFLYNDRLFKLAEDANPAADPNFPLDPGQYKALSVDHVMALLGQALEADPALAETKPRFVLSLCYMLHAKGGINAVRIDIDETEGSGGLGIKCGQVPEATLAILSELRDRGALSLEMVDQTVWTQLK